MCPGGYPLSKKYENVDFTCLFWSHFHPVSYSHIFRFHPPHALSIFKRSRDTPRFMKLWWTGNGDIVTLSKIRIGWWVHVPGGDIPLAFGAPGRLGTDTVEELKAAARSGWSCGIQHSQKMTWHDLPNKWLTCCDTHPGGFTKWGLPRLTFLVLIFLWHASWRRRRTLRDTANVASVRVKWNPKKIVTITVLIIHHCMWVQPKRIESKNYMKLLGFGNGCFPLKYQSRHTKEGLPQVKEGWKMMWWFNKDICIMTS